MLGVTQRSRKGNNEEWRADAENVLPKKQGAAALKARPIATQLALKLGKKADTHVTHGCGSGADYFVVIRLSGGESKRVGTFSTLNSAPYWPAAAARHGRRLERRSPGHHLAERPWLAPAQRLCSTCGRDCTTNQAPSAVRTPSMSCRGGKGQCGRIPAQPGGLGRAAIRGSQQASAGPPAQGWQQALTGAAMPGTRAAACSTHLRDAAKGLLHPRAQLCQLNQQVLPQLAVKQQRLGGIVDGVVLQGCKQGQQHGMAWATARRSSPPSRQRPQRCCRQSKDSRCGPEECSAACTGQVVCNRHAGGLPSRHRQPFAACQMHKAELCVIGAASWFRHVPSTTGPQPAHRGKARCRKAQRRQTPPGPRLHWGCRARGWSQWPSRHGRI